MNIFDRTELYKAVNKLNGGKAYSTDLLMNKMIKSAVTVIEKPWLKLFNMSTEHGIFPDAWCKGHIIPIYKSGDRSDPKIIAP